MNGFVLELGFEKSVKVPGTKNTKVAEKNVVVHKEGESKEAPRFVDRH